MNDPHFSLHKMLSDNLNSDYLSAGTAQIEICFLKLYFSPLIRTPIEWTNKPMLVDVNQLNKAI